MGTHEDIYQIDLSFDKDKILEAYHTLTETTDFSRGLVRAISLNRMPNNKSIDPRGIFWIQDNDYNEVQREQYVDESAYTELIPAIKNTYFELIYNQLCEQYRIGRMRILSLSPRKSLSYHRDPEPRLHIPIITNPGSLLIVDNYCTHIPANGGVYFMNTQKYHTALNGGESLRVHLVVTVLEKKEKQI